MIEEKNLIEQYIEPDDNPVTAWVRGYGVPIWALIGYLRVVDGNIEQVATDYDLPRDAVEAAIAYYNRHRQAIDAKLTLIAL